MKKLNLKNRAEKASKGKLSTEETQHLRRVGVAITKKTKSLSKRPIRRLAAWWETTTLEKLLEDVEFLLKNAALLEIINLVANVTIIISLGTWLLTEKQRRNAEIYQAWQVITAAHNQSGSGGRIEALEFLNSRPLRLPWIGWTVKKGWYWDEGYKRCERKRLAGLRWERQLLLGLSAPNNAYLIDIHLCGAYLWRADLSGAYLILIKVEFLTPQQIKSACFWEEAIYKAEWNKEKKTWEVNVLDNEKFIKKLKDDQSSDPKEPIDCKIWEK